MRARFTHQGFRRLVLFKSELFEAIYGFTGTTSMFSHEVSGWWWLKTFHYVILWGSPTFSSGLIPADNDGDTTAEKPDSTGTAPGSDIFALFAQININLVQCAELANSKNFL